MDLKKLNVQELGTKEVKEIEAGNPVLGAFLFALAWSAWENVGDIRDGWNDGSNGKPARYK